MCPVIPENWFSQLDLFLSFLIYLLISILSYFTLKIKFIFNSYANLKNIPTWMLGYEGLATWIDIAPINVEWRRNIVEEWLFVAKSQCSPWFPSSLLWFSCHKVVPKFSHHILEYIRDLVTKMQEIIQYLVPLFVLHHILSMSLWSPLYAYMTDWEKPLYFSLVDHTHGSCSLL